MKVINLLIATDLKVGDIIKKDGFTYEVKSEPIGCETFTERVPWGRKPSECEFKVEILDYNSRTYPYSYVMENKARAGDIESITYRKKTVVRTYKF